RPGVGILRRVVLGRFALEHGAPRCCLLLGGLVAPTIATAARCNGKIPVAGGHLVRKSTRNSGAKTIFMIKGDSIDH
ncbi:MAG: hypothetical protein ACOYO2_14235, partial [Mycobacterium sp.]